MPFETVIDFTQRSPTKDKVSGCTPYLIPFMHLTNDLIRGRVDGGERLPAHGVHEFVVDEQLAHERKRVAVLV